MTFFIKLWLKTEILSVNITENTVNINQTSNYTSHTPLPENPVTLSLFCLGPPPSMLVKNNTDAAHFKAYRLVAK